jgi:hypothetical protein
MIETVSANNINWMGNRVVDGSAPRPAVPASAPAAEDGAPVSVAQPPAAEKGYIPYYLTQNIGKSVRAEFIIGASQYVDKTGVISEVGVNYFVLDDINSRTRTMCDLYSVKFVTILVS